MDPKRRASSGHNQIGSVTSPSPSGVTSVWVGSRPSKDPPRPPPPKAVNNNHSTLSDNGTDGHLTTRRVSTGTGKGEYVVVSVRNSISEPATSTPFSRRNSTVITPMSTTFSGSGRPVSSSDQTSSGGSHPFPSTSSLGGPQQQTNSTLQATSTGSTTNSCARDWNDLGKPSNIPANKSSITENILSGNSQNILGNSSLNSASGSLLNNNLFNSSNCLMNSLLYNAGNFVPPVTPSMNMLPLTSPGLSSLLFPQSCGLSADLLASSLNQSLNLSQMPNLKQPHILPQTSSLLGLTQSSYLPIPSVGQSQIFPQTSSLLGFPPIPLLPMPSTTPLDMLSSTLSTNQALLPSNLQFPTLFPTPPALPLTTTPGILSIESSAVPADQNLTHSKSPPPLLNQKPSEAFHAKRASLKAKEATTREAKPPKRLSWSSPSVDQEDEQTTSGVESLTPSRRSSSTSLPDSICEVDYPEDDYLPVVTVEPCYDPPYHPQACMRCGKRVYTMEKQVGPVRRVLYHKPCFTCVACGTVLTLNNYQLNDDDKGDLNVYCASHKPWVRHSPLDSEALLLQQAVLTLPRPQICA